MSLWPPLHVEVMEANEMAIEVTGTDEMPIEVMEAMEANEMIIEVMGTNEMPVQVMEANEMQVPMENQSEIVAGICFFYPQVIDEFKPTIGQRFETLDEVLEFYNNYAREAGFSVRMHSSKKNKDGEITRKEFVCNKEGSNTKEWIGDEQKRRGLTKEGCKARLIVVRSKLGRYAVTIFDEGHNHPMTSPRRRHLLKSHRKVTKYHKILADQLDMANIPPHKQFDILELQVGGIENVGCTQEDLYNYRRNVRNKMKGHDGKMLHDHFLLEQERNSEFTFKIQADEEHKITQCFWADASSRQAYKFYGDVVIFDTTYNTNRYSMIFVPFMGVNNHGQTIVFAGAFLSDETTDSFVWLFREFLNAMLGDAPKMIISDQDPAMTKAIPYCFPNTFHRLCTWHILDKFSSKLPAMKYRDHYLDFKASIWESETREEFDVKWMAVVSKSGLSGNGWLQSIYRIRSTWVPTYVNHVFSANCSTSQRAESGHSFLKKYVSKNNSFLEFMVKYNRALVRQRHLELKANHIDLNERPKLKCPIKMDAQMANIYTRSSYLDFQEQLWESYSYNIELTSENDTCSMFKVLPIDDEKGRVGEILYEKSRDFASCSCKQFDSSGIPCSHLLAYLHKICQFQILPDEYILKRWTKSAKSSVTVSNVEISVDKSILERRGKLFQQYSHLIDKVIQNDEASKLFCEAMDAVNEKIKPLVGGTNENVEPSATKEDMECRAKRKSIVDDVGFLEPDPVKTKASGKRFKKGKEKGKCKKRVNGNLCHGCGQYGVNMHGVNEVPLFCISLFYEFGGIGHELEGIHVFCMTLFGNL